jgi:hypothetical protein
MGVSTSEVGYISITTGRGYHEIHKEHMVGKKKKKLLGIYYSCWRIDLYSAENLTLWEVDQEYLGIFELLCWGRMEMIS